MATDRGPVCVLILSGLRPKAALVNIRWEHIDLKHKRVITTEKGVSRQLPLTGWAVTELKRFAAKAKLSDRVWTNSKRKGFSHCEALATASEVPEISLQALRRAFVFRLWQLGVSPQITSKLAGHTVETAMRFYADSELLALGGEVEQLDWMQDHSKTIAKKGS